MSFLSSRPQLRFGIICAPIERGSLSQMLYHQRYWNPYSVQRWSGMRSSGLRRPPSYMFTNGKLSFDCGYKKKFRAVTASPRKENDEINLRKKVTTVKVAAMFRNNLIKVFGYILHRPEMELNTDLYTSLYFLLSTIKLNQVNILSITPVLAELAFSTSNERFLKIFGAMQEEFPAHLKCIAEFWENAIKTGEVNLDHILKPTKDGPLKVDIFQGISDELLRELRPESKVADLREEETKILYNFNMNIVYIMRFLRQAEQGVQQLFFGALLLHFPRSTIQPDLEESIQMVMEFLEQHDVPDWEKYVGQLSVDPHRLAKDLLGKLLASAKIAIVIKEAAQTILNNLKDRNPTAINPHYDSVSTLVGVEDIETDAMLKYFSVGAYPTEIVIAGIRLSYYAKHNYIRRIAWLTHFQPYVYSSPTEVLIALLYRVIKRQPDLPLEIINSAAAAYSHLTFVFRYVGLPLILPDDVATLDIITWAVQAPDLDPTDRHFIMLHINGYTKHLRLKKNEILTKAPVPKCATPVMCLFAQEEMMDYIRYTFAEKVYKNPCFIRSCRLGKPQNGSTLFPVELNPLVRKSFDGEATDTTISTTPSPSEGPISSPRTFPPTIASPPRASGEDKAIEQATEVMPSNPTAVINILQAVTSDDTDTIYARKILKILHSGRYRDEFLAMKESTHVIVITGVLTYLDLVTVNHKRDFETLVYQYLDKFFRKLKQVDNIIHLITIEKNPTKPELLQLTVAVPAPRDNETTLFRHLASLLRREDLFALIVHDIKREQYRNVGSLLRAVLNAEVKLKDKLTPQELEAAKYYSDKIQLHGFGNGKVMWGVEINILEKEVDISQVMNNACDFDNMPRYGKKMFNLFLAYLKDNLDLLRSWDKWVYYETCGEFTIELLYFISRSDPPLDIRMAIGTLRRSARYDRTGKEPVLPQHTHLREKKKI